jgi:hypothetical protein
MGRVARGSRRGSHRLRKPLRCVGNGQREWLVRRLAVQRHGYSIVEADSLQDAVAKTKGCPILDSGGTVEVFEAIAM